MNRSVNHEPRGMYIILSTMKNGGIHWGIFVMVSYPFGMVYNATDNDGTWRFEEHMTEIIPYSDNILGGLLIKRPIDENTQDQIREVLSQVPCRPEGDYISRWGKKFYCTVWVKDAVERLRLAGLIGNYSAERICLEALNLGEGARRNGQRGNNLPSQVPSSLKRKGVGDSL